MSFMKKKTKKLIYSYILVITILLSFLLRVINLDSNPPHLTPDEASLGYNAYSILKTGKDEYGKVLPFVFKSFGDYKPGLYVYLTVPFVFVLGLTENAVRLPSALMGVIAVYVIYLIAKRLFKEQELWISSALFLAISPWHIQLSRGAWEVNVALTFVLLGIYFFLRSFERNHNLVWSSLFFSLTLLTYQGAKLSSLIVIGLLGLFYYKKIFTYKKKILI